MSRRGPSSAASSTTSIPIGIAPIVRMHPAIAGQAATTAATQLPDRFIFGLGTAENLNEHIIAERGPSHDVRLEMLEEAIEIVRLL